MNPPCNDHASQDDVSICRRTPVAKQGRLDIIKAQLLKEMIDVTARRGSRNGARSPHICAHGRIVQAASTLGDHSAAFWQDDATLHPNCVGVDCHDVASRENIPTHTVQRRGQDRQGKASSAGWRLSSATDRRRATARARRAWRQTARSEKNPLIPKQNFSLIGRTDAFY